MCILQSKNILLTRVDAQQNVIFKYCTTEKQQEHIRSESKPFLVSLFRGACLLKTYQSEPNRL